MELLMTTETTTQPCTTAGIGSRNNEMYDEELCSTRNTHLLYTAAILLPIEGNLARDSFGYQHTFDSHPCGKAYVSLLDRALGGHGRKPFRHFSIVVPSCASFTIESRVAPRFFLFLPPGRAAIRTTCKT